MNHKSVTIAAACVAAFVLTTTSGCGPKAPGETTDKSGAKSTEGAANAANEATPVRIASAKSETVTRNIPITGSVSATQTVALSPKVAGKVIAVVGREGQAVKAGQVVVQQDTADLITQLQQVEANAQAARARLAQARTTATLQITTSSTGVQDAEASLRSAQEQLSLAKRPQRTQEVAVSQNLVAQAQANYDRAKADRKRYEELVREGAAAQITLDQYATQEEVQKAALDTAKQQLSISQTGGRTEQVRSAEAAVARAQAQLRQAKSNVGQNQVRQDEINAAVASVAQADAQAAQARQAVKDASIVSPIDGVIATRATEPGQFASPGATVMQVVRLQTVYFEAQVPETEIASVVPGKPVQVRVDAFPGRSFAGRVARVYPTGSTSSRTFRVRVEVPNTSGLLRPGLFAQGVVAAETKRGVVVPKDAVVSDGENFAVYVAENGSVARRRTVKIGIQTTDTTEIVSGIRDGESVIVAGQSGLRDGGPIVVKTGSATPVQAASAG